MAENEDRKANQKLIRRVNKARNFPHNTCAASRHVQEIGEALATGKPYPMLEEEPAYVAGSLLSVVASLYEARTLLAGRQEAATQDLVKAVDALLDPTGLEIALAARVQILEAKLAAAISARDGNHAAAVLAEREACARMADQMAEQISDENGEIIPCECAAICDRLAAAIRSRQGN